MRQIVVATMHVLASRCSGSLKLSGMQDNSSSVEKSADGIKRSAAIAEEALPVDMAWHFVHYIMRVCFSRDIHGMHCVYCAMYMTAQTYVAWLCEYSIMCVFQQDMYDMLLQSKAWSGHAERAHKVSQS